ncbi:uncharacterized protein LOC143590661 [Bidens hawaiensis]|uniref:uncharacterized protein LOC143590661 n=1 Tax=Bidens hawaiensis TaxID=980011 RepID=UPI004049741F
MERYISGTILVASFWANDNCHDNGYYLGDGIYPEYVIIVKAFRDPLDEKRQHCKKVQESLRKDIEKCFGVLQQRWHFVKKFCRLWSLERMKSDMYACIIMHNMIIKYEGRKICSNFIPDSDPPRTPTSMEQRLEKTYFVRSREMHNALMGDLVQHIWVNRRLPGENENQNEGNDENEDGIDDEDEDDEGVDGDE